MSDRHAKTEAALAAAASSAFGMLERALRKPGPTMREALAPFADVAGEGDEDLPDDTPVTVTFGGHTHYALTLADLRRARDACYYSEED